MDDVDFLRDRFGGLLDVSGDHDDGDSGVLALRDGVLDLRSGGVSHADDSDQNRLLLELTVVGRVSHLLVSLIAKDRYEKMK